MDISHNIISANINDFFTNLPFWQKLETLSFNDNLFTVGTRGAIDCYSNPAVLGAQYGTVKVLNGARNKLSGAVPWCFTAPIQKIDLSSNNFDSISNIALGALFSGGLDYDPVTTLQRLDLQNNRVCTM